MLKTISKRWLSMTLVFMMLISIIPTIAYAANVNTGVTGLTAESSGAANWSYSGGTITGSVKANKSSGCIGDSFSAQNGTLTFTNGSGATALLSFDYELTLSGGSATVDGAAVTADATFNKTLEAGGTVAIKITSNATNENATSITISNLKLTEEKDVYVTFNAPTNGSYTVNSEEITAQTVKTFKTTDSVTLAAAAATGYKFFGWYNETTGSYISNNSTFTTSFTENTTVEPKFVSSSAPVFQVGSRLFTDLNEATGYAQSSGIAKIALVANGTLPAGNYTIPSGKTLLIPYDAGHTVCTTSTQVEENNYTTPSVYKKLTMASGANITLDSGASLSVGSKISSQGTSASSHNGTPSGPYGQIEMKTGSSITAKANANIYAYGFITGDGSVIAEKSSTVYECFQIRDWRGGSASSSIVSDSVFPFNQYYVQNIEAPLTIYPGATEVAFSSANMPRLSMYPALSVEFIGNNGMFKVNTGAIIKRYDKTTDRLVIDLNDASASISPITLSGLPMVGDIKTTDFILPLSNKISINVNGKSSVAINQNLSMQPGTKLKIGEEAEVIINQDNAVYIYDGDDWNGKNFAAGGSPLVVNCYIGSTGKAGTIRPEDTVDAQIEVNGTLTVNGNLCTSTEGANIMSSAQGKVVLNAATKAGTVNESVGTSGKLTPVSFTAAKLQNADGSYYETAGKPAGTEIPYSEGEWGKDPSQTVVTATWKNYDGTVLATSEVTSGETPAVPEAAQNPTRPATAEFTYTFSGWEPALGPITTDTTYVAQFTETKNSYTVTFVDEDGTTVLDTQTVEYGVTPVYSKDEPTKVGDAQYSYTFAGWTPALAPVTGNVTYQATYTQAVNKYTVIWKNDDGTVLETDKNVPYGTTPTYDGATPEKASTPEFTFTFAGWDKQVVEVTGDVVYTATYSQTTREYTITWIVDGVSTTSTVKYGDTPVYSGSDPAKESTAEFTYTFTGWSPAIVAVTGDATYIAQFEAQRRSYTITWLNDDGSVIDTTTVAYGETPTHADAVKAADAQYTYTFTGWSPAIVAVTGEATYTATFSQTVNTYTITWKNDDGSVIDTTTVAYGETPTHADAVKAETMLETFAFAGWTPDVVPVIGEAVYTARFTTVPKSGWIDWEGAKYYIVDGAPVKGVYEIEGDFYIFDIETGAFRSDANGPTDVGEDTYLADSGMVVKNPGLVRIPETEEYFYFGEDNKALKNQRTWIDRTNDLLPVWAYTFTATGAIEHVDVTWEGLQDDGYTYIDGIRVYLGLVQETDGSYHYYNSTGLHIVGRSYWISKTNPETVKDPNGNPFPQASYEFDAQGRMILPGSPDAKNGIVEEDGSLYYYVDNVRTYAGLIQIDGDYYYVRYGGEVVHGTDYWVTKNNGIMPSARYNFADDGKMIVPQSKEGIVEEDGSLYYYVDNVRTYAGLIQIDGDYYYVRSSGEVVHGTDYWVTKNNDIVPSARYTFGEDGKMVLTGTPLDPTPQPEVKNGIYEENGAKYYYEDGVKKYAGVIRLEDPDNPGTLLYYYVTSSCQLKTSSEEGKLVKYTASLTNGLLEVGRYQFDVQGRMYDLQGNLLTAPID